MSDSSPMTVAAAEQLEAEKAAQAEAGAAAAEGEQPIRHPHAKPKPRKAKAKRKRPSAEGRAATAGSFKSKAQRDSELTAELARVLVFPAIPAQVAIPDPATKQFVAGHFVQTGPRTARELVALSQGSPELRAWLERAAKGSLAFTGTMIAITYLGPVALALMGWMQAAHTVQFVTQADDSQLEELAAMMAAANATASPPTESAEQPGAAPAEHAGAEADTPPPG